MELIREAARWERDTHTLWTDGSALPSGVAAAAVIGFVEPSTDGEATSTRRFIAKGDQSIRSQRSREGSEREAEIMA